MSEPKPLIGAFKTKRLRKKVKRVFRDSFENGYTKEEDIVNTTVCLIKEKMRELKHHIKSACEFFLRYWDRPALFLKDFPEFEKEFIKRKFMTEEGEFTANLFDEYVEYVEWLFKLAFKDVLEGD